MDFFKDMGKKVTEAGKVVGDKSKQIAEATKLGYKISAAEREKEELFTVLGKLVYEEEKGKAEFAFFSKCEEISAKQDEIDDLKAKKNALNGVVVCSSCGAEQSGENDYCCKCGTKLEKPVPAPVETSAEEASSPTDEPKE